MRADALLEWEIKPEPYGNALKTTNVSAGINLAMRLPRSSDVIRNRFLIQTRF